MRWVFFYDEGLRSEDGLPAYTILRQAMVPFGLEKMGISQAMKEQSVDIALDVQSRTVFFQRARGADQVAEGFKGKASGHKRLQQHPPLGDPDSVAQGRARLGKRH